LPIADFVLGLTSRQGRTDGGTEGRMMQDLRYPIRVLLKNRGAGQNEPRNE